MGSSCCVCLSPLYSFCSLPLHYTDNNLGEWAVQGQCAVSWTKQKYKDRHAQGCPCYHRQAQPIALVCAQKKVIKGGRAIPDSLEGCPMSEWNLNRRKGPTIPPVSFSCLTMAPFVAECQGCHSCDLCRLGSSFSQFQTKLLYFLIIDGYTSHIAQSHSRSVVTRGRLK